MYNYVDDGLLKIKNYEKLLRNTKVHHVRKNKKKLGRSIEERPEEINYCEVFGHWECDLVLGHKTKDDSVLLPLYERKTRKFIIIPIADKTSDSVDDIFAIEEWTNELPRKIQGYHIPNELYEKESDLIYQIQS